MSGGIGQYSIHSNQMVSKIVEYLYKDATLFLPRKYDIAIKAKEILQVQDYAEKQIQHILGRNAKDYIEVITARETE
jgi:hypothetical protein